MIKRHNKIVLISILLIILVCIECGCSSSAENISKNLLFSEPTVYVDNESRGRSGHMSHAMAEFAPNKVIAFNSNCSTEIQDGHMPYGYIEYRISEDGGESFGESRDLEYSVTAFNSGEFTVSVEKAVACDGRIVAFCLRNTFGDCEPWFTPTYVTSDDGGETWSDAIELCGYRGRVYDAIVRDGTIYALVLCNKNFLGSKKEHVYRIYKSEDCGETFSELCVVPIKWFGRGYGAFTFREDGSLVVYAYNVHNETHLDYAISYDCGKNFTETGKSHVAKKIRNPQIAFMDGIYVLHGRGGNRNFVFYTSTDGINWDEGYCLGTKRAYCYYSENIVLHDQNGNERMLVHYSDTYSGKRVNVMSVWVTKSQLASD